MSLRNYGKRKIHKERSQPASRSRYGLLEKKKDYKLRAQDYHKKEDRLKHLKRQAALRNPDEFYFKMIRATTKDGADHVSYTPPEEMTEEELQILRTQDIGYLFSALQKEKREIEKLQALLSVHEIEQTEGDTNESPKVNKHIVFVDNEEELESFSPTKYFDTPEELLRRKHNRLTNKQLEEPVIIAGKELLKLDDDDGNEDTTKSQRKAFKKLKKLRDKNYLELKERQARAEKIKKLIQEKQLEKNMATKGEKVRVNDDSDEEDERPVYKWRAIRQK